MSDSVIITANGFPDPTTLALVSDVQYREPYSSAAINRKLRGLALPGIYTGFNPTPGTGLNVLISSGDDGGTCSFNIGDYYQLSVRQQSDVTVAMTAGTTKIIALQATYAIGTETYQVNAGSTTQAAEIVLLDATATLASNQLALCKVTIPSGTTQITSAMIDLTVRVQRSLSFELSSAIDSDDEEVAATSLAVKDAIAYLESEIAAAVATKVLTVSGAATLSSTLSVASALTAKSTLAVTGATTLTGAATLKSTLSVVGNAILSAALSVGTTLTVTGASALGSTLTVSGAATLSSTLAVTDATTLNSTLKVTGATTLSSTLAVAGTSTLTGAVTAASTLKVTGAATLSSTLAVVGASTFTGAITAASTVTASDVISTSSELVSTAANGSNHARFNNGTYSTIQRVNGANFYILTTASGDPTGTYNSLRPLTIALATGAVTLGHAVSMSSTLGVSGATTLSDALTVAGTSTLSGATALSSTLSVTGAATLSSTLKVTGATTLSSTLGVSGATTLSSTLKVTGAATLSSTLNVTGAASVGSSLTVTGTAAFSSDVTIGGSLTLSGVLMANKHDSCIQFSSSDSTQPIYTLNYSSAGNFGFWDSTNAQWLLRKDTSGNWIMPVGGLTVAGATSISSTLSVTGATTMSGTVTAAKDMTVGSTLTSNYRMRIIRSDGYAAYMDFIRSDVVAGTAPTSDTQVMYIQAKSAGSTTSVENGYVLGIFATYATTSGGGRNVIQARSATNTITSQITMNGDAGTVSVVGDTTLTGALNVTGTATLNGTAVLSGYVTTNTSATETIPGPNTQYASSGNLYTPKLRMAGNAGNAETLIALQGYSYSTNGFAAGISATRSLGVIGSHGQVTTGKNVFTLMGSASDGSAYQTVGRIDFYTSEDTTSTSAAGEVRILTTPSGTVTPSLAAKFGSDSSLYVYGDHTVAGAAALKGAATLSKTLAVTGATSVGGALTVTGATALASSLTVSGAITGSGILNLNNSLSLTDSTSATLFVANAGTDGSGGITVNSFAPTVAFVDRTTNSNGFRWRADANYFRLDVDNGDNGATWNANQAVFNSKGVLGLAGAGVSAGVALLLGYNTAGNGALTGTGQYGAAAHYNVGSDATVRSVTFLSETTVGDGSTSQTLADWVDFWANSQTVNTNASVTLASAFRAYDKTSTSVATTYAFDGRMATRSGVNRWNLYMQGTAPNYIRGQTIIGGTDTSLPSSTYGLEVRLASSFTSDVVIAGASTQTGAVSMGSTLSVASSINSGYRVNITRGDGYIPYINFIRSDLADGTNPTTDTAVMQLFGKTASSTTDPTNGRNLVLIQGYYTTNGGGKIALEARNSSGSTTARVLASGDDGSVTVTGSMSTTGALSVGSSLTVSGSAAFSGTTTFSGAVNFNGILYANRHDSCIYFSSSDSTQPIYTLDYSSAGNFGFWDNTNSAWILRKDTTGNWYMYAGLTTSDYLTVGGVATLKSSLNVTGATTLSSTLDVSGVVTVGGSLRTTRYLDLGYQNTSAGSRQITFYSASNTTATSSISVTGTTAAASVMAITSGTVAIAGDATVSGALTATGAVTTSGELVSTASGNNLRLSNGTYSVIHRTYGAYYYLLLTDSGSSTGSYNSLRPLTMTLSTGDISLGTALTVGTTLSVTGATSLGSSLTVSGSTALSGSLVAGGSITASTTLSVTGAATLSSTLKVTGATTLSSTLAVTGAATLSSTLKVTGAATLSGGLTVTGTITSSGNIYTNSGASYLKTDGNVYGSVWGGTLSDYIDSKAKTLSTLSAAENGYWKDNNTGLVIQWGTCAVGDDLQNTFPVAFPTACSHVYLTQTDSSSGSNSKSNVSATYVSTTGFVSHIYSSEVSGNYLAIGW